MKSCREITYLVSKEQEKALTATERIQLLLHVMMCGQCRRYRRQSEAVARAVRQLK